MTLDLERRMARLAPVFDLDRIERAGTGPDAVKRYYRASRWAYSRFQGPENMLHVGLSRGDGFEPDDLCVHLRRVEALMPAGGRVLELAAGRGANSAWLARARPDARLDMLELSPAQLGFARREAAAHPNLALRAGDYHDLSAWGDGSVDVVFVLDALCYSTAKARVFAEVARVLTPGGAMLVTDGYAGPHERSPAEERAARLAERGMAVARFEPYGAVREAALAAGFAVEAEEEHGLRTVPNWRRFERLAERYLARPRLARLANRVLPFQLTANAVTAYLIVPCMERRIFTYWLTVLRKPA